MREKESRCNRCTGAVAGRSAEKRERRQSLNWRGRGGDSSSREGVAATDFELGGRAVEGGETTLGRLLGLGKNNIFL